MAGGSPWDMIAAATNVQRSSESNVEDEADSPNYVSPDRIKFSPGVAKAWVSFVGDPLSVSYGYNVLSIEDLGIGSYQINFDVDLSTNTVVTVTSALSLVSITSVLGSSVVVSCFNYLGAALDCSYCNLVAFSDTFS